jgi:hypothetical protein
LIEQPWENSGQKAEAKAGAKAEANPEEGLAAAVLAEETGGQESLEAEILEDLEENLLKCMM